MSEEEELSQIVELPSLGPSYDDSNGLRSEFVYFDSVDGWLFPPPEDYGEYFTDPPATVVPSMFEDLLL